MVLARDAEEARQHMLNKTPWDVDGVSKDLEGLEPTEIHEIDKVVGFAVWGGG